MATDAADNAGAGVYRAGNEAIGAVNEGTNQGNALLGDTLGGITQTLSPYTSAGSTATGLLTNALSSTAPQFQGINPQDVASSPEYQFQLQQGTNALQRAQAATGSVLGGGAQKSLAQYSQGLASTSYQNAYNNALAKFQTNQQSTNSRINALLGLSGQGLAGTQQLAQMQYGIGGQQAQNTIGNSLYGGNMDVANATYGGNALMNASQIAGQALTGGANATAAGQVGQSNAWNSAIGGVTNATTNALAGYPWGGGNTNSWGGSTIAQNVARQGSMLPGGPNALALPRYF